MIRSPLTAVLVLACVYFATHLPFLNTLPVFADEAIYIRWAQLILDDWQQYLFFPLNDGKTPLFVWLVTVALKLVSDPLIAGRLITALAGFGQVLVTMKLTEKLGGKKLAVFVSALLVLFLPFWYFHHRIALMDGLMVFWLSLSWLWLLTAVETTRVRWSAVIAAGIAFGLALLTKIPALLFAPTLVLAPWLVRPKKLTFRFILAAVNAVMGIGIAVFLSLKLHPAFSQLFSRGGDFLYPLSELLARGVWPVFLFNLKNTWVTLSAYLTLPVLFLPLVGLFQNRWRRKHALLLLSALSFIVPIALLGKTVYPRYFLPVALPFTLSAALAFEQFFRTTQKRFKKPFSLLARAVFLVLVASATLSSAFQFMLISWENTDFLPFTLSDRVQYVLEWSSGHGIKQVSERIVEESRFHTLAVATEGHFGTLPDGILMYLHNQDVTHLMVEGIGQPVRQIPESFIQKAHQYEKVWLVVNSHRQQMSLDTMHPEWLLQEYCRPVGNPCLQVWDITQLVQLSNAPPITQ